MIRKTHRKSSISSTIGFKKAFAKREIRIHSRAGFKIGVIMKLICDRICRDARLQSNLRLLA